jgi:hypothetical protein
MIAGSPDANIWIHLTAGAIFIEPKSGGPHTRNPYRQLSAYPILSGCPILSEAKGGDFHPDREPHLQKRAAPLKPALA